MTELTTINRICEHLEKYVFDKIWNDPYSEYRTFTVAESLNTVAAAGIFFGRYDQVQLPSEVKYRSTSKLFFYVYAIPAQQFRSIRLNVLEWVSLADYCTDNLVDIEFFSDSGRKMIHNGVFICQAEKNDCILVAVEQTGFLGCFGDDAQPNARYYFGEMFDSDLHPSIKYVDFRLLPSQVPNHQSGVIYDPITKGGEPTYALFNGKLLSGNYMNSLSSYGFVEKVFDENIVGIFDTSMDQYYTNKNYAKKVLIHIPKEYNPEHVIITANTCDLYLVPTEMEAGAGSSSTSGIYLFQNGRDQYFHQLTHNDFSIDLEWLQSVASANRFKKWVVRTMVRICDKTKKAIRDANYLNILYLHDDDDIMKFLLGTSEWNMEFWTAKHLESSMYGKAEMRRRSVRRPLPADQCDQCAVKNICDSYPKTELQCPAFNRRSLQDYVDLIGYYHTLALIGKRVTYFEVTDDRISKKYHGDVEVGKSLPEYKGTWKSEFIVRAPLALQEFTEIDYYPVVYFNGLRVPQENVEVRIGPNADNHYAKELEFTADASWWTKVIDINYSYRLRVIVKNQKMEVGDKVVVELFDNRHDGGVRQITTPTTTNYNVTSDTAFKKNKRYFYRNLDGNIASASIKEEMIGQPIGPDYEYDVGQRRLVPPSEEVPFPHEEVVKVSEFYGLAEETLIKMSSEHDWKLYFVNEEQDKRYYPTRDNVIVQDKTYYVPVNEDGIEYTIENDRIGDIDLRRYGVAHWNDQEQMWVFDYSTWINATATVKFVPATALPGTSTTSNPHRIYFELSELAHVNNVTYYELEDPGTFDRETLELNLDPRHFGKNLFLVDGPLTFDDHSSEDITENSLGYLGKTLWQEPIQTLDNFPLDSEVVFLNQHRLIRGLDYTMEGYNPANFHNGAKLYLQNVSYLRQHSVYDVVRTNQATLSNQRGFLKGNIIYWNHQNPFWFDELSVLTIGGKVCSNIIHEFGTITLQDGPYAQEERDFMTLNHPGGYDNGSPFEFRMSVSSKVKRLVGEYGLEEDRSKIEAIKAYYDARFKKPDYITVVKRSHKIYSLYTEQIITAYVSDPNFDFTITPSRYQFERQFADFTDWKMRDVAFTLTPEELKYVDIYPLFNRLKTTDRYQFKKISTLVKMLLPTDKYQHKDASNVK